ncbi:MAG: hypothetical protein HYS27_02420 [Deltaproteobacteria bacterium]|nr:hypothetical protein [Deltaproteobacteria bacterium]
MKRILRSIIDCGDVGGDHLLANYHAFVDAGLEPAAEHDTEIVQYIREFHQEFNSAPTLTSVQDAFEHGFAALERLKEIKDAESYIGTQFRRLLKTLKEKQRENGFDLLLKESARIKTQGVKVGKLTKKGIDAALQNLVEGADRLRSDADGARTSGALREESADILARYAERVTSPRFGRLLGLEKIDEVCRGLRAGELMLCLGFVGHGKTTFALNYAYNTAMIYGWDVIYFSLEMTRVQITDVLYTMHSMHPKFVDPESPNFSAVAPLDYRAIRDGLLAPEQHEFFKEVAHDMDSVREYSSKTTDGDWRVPYGEILIETPSKEVTVAEIKMKAEMHARRLEAEGRELGLVIIDHALLVESSVGRSVDNYTVSVNYILRDVARMAVMFNGGKGIPVCMPFQANRTGWDAASKNDGHYKLNALSYANEAEKSASVITYVYMDDDMRDEGRVKIGCLKNRDNPHFKQFEARILWGPRRLIAQREQTPDEIALDLGL